MDGPIVYKVFRGRTLLHHGKEASLPPMLLTTGPRQNNYTYYLTVNIFDKFHSHSATVLSVTVREQLIIEKYCVISSLLFGTYRCRMIVPLTAADSMKYYFL